MTDRQIEAGIKKEENMDSRGDLNKEMNAWDRASDEVAFPFFIPDETKGELMSPGLSQLDYACIHLKVPRTKKPWLDELITESLRNEMAGRAT